MTWFQYLRMGGAMLHACGWPHKQPCWNRTLGNQFPEVRLPCRWREQPERFPLAACSLRSVAAGLSHQQAFFGSLSLSWALLSYILYAHVCVRACMPTICAPACIVSFLSDIPIYFSDQFLLAHDCNGLTMPNVFNLHIDRRREIFQEPCQAPHGFTSQCGQR